MGEVIRAGMSVNRASRICALSRSMYYRAPKKKDDDIIREELSKLAKEHIRWGFKKMQATLRRSGQPWNHKRVRRIYRALGLNIRKRPKKRLPSRMMETLIQPEKANECWSIDFMSDALMNGIKFRTFNVLDDFNREGLGIKIGKSLSTQRVIDYLDSIAEIRGYPKMIRIDNGPEFVSKSFCRWASRRGITLKYIQPGKPAQNGFIERFNRTYREDVLDINLFSSLEEVQMITDQWLHEYNYSRPHEALGNKAPRDVLLSLSGMPERERKGAVHQQSDNCLL
jgi:putative transposase